MTSRGPVAADAAIAVAAMAIRAGVKVAGGVAPLLRTQRWPRPLRALAENGYARRQEATAFVLEWYRTTAPAVVRDVLDRLDLAQIVLEVVGETDLPGLVRQTTESVAEATMRDFRVRTMTADDTVSRWVGRLRRSTVDTPPVVG